MSKNVFGWVFPTWSAWPSRVVVGCLGLVLLAKMVENNGFEPLTLCVQGRCSSQLS